MKEPSQWAELINAISKFISIHGLVIAGVVTFIILLMGGCVFVVWFVYTTKNQEIERLVKERNKWQGHFIKNMRSSKKVKNELK